MSAKTLECPQHTYWNTKIDVPLSAMQTVSGDGGGALWNLQKMLVIIQQPSRDPIMGWDLVRLYMGTQGWVGFCSDDGKHDVPKHVGDLLKSGVCKVGFIN